jgi:hypothetical protein
MITNLAERPRPSGVYVKKSSRNYAAWRSGSALSSADAVGRRWTVASFAAALGAVCGRTILATLRPAVPAEGQRLICRYYKSMAGLLQFSEMIR